MCSHLGGEYRTPAGPQSVQVKTNVYVSQTKGISVAAATSTSSWTKKELHTTRAHIINDGVMAIA